MTENVCQTAQERVCRPIVAAHEQDTASDGTGPQNAPEGTVDMKSIDNLREYVENAPSASIGLMVRAIPLGMARTIEREAMEERTAAYNEGYDAGFASADDWAAQHEDAMAEHGFVRLPKDADGEAIHVGDVMDEQLPFGGYAAPAPVDTMELSRGAGGYGWMVRLDSESGAFINPKLLRHHHAPTVEDVLREFAERVCNSGHQWGLDAADTIAEYAARLRLAEGVDE